ncbi:MAG: hypothetical protein J6B01_00005, partial [Ruminococcus sp.]|nr:hypothetical protein [Ruminococcus sp.]
MNKIDAGGVEVKGATLKLTGTDANGNAINFAEGSLELGEGATLQNGSGENLVWISGTGSTNVKVPNGTYILHEERAPEGYEVATDITFTVNNGKVTVIGEDGNPVEKDSIDMIDETTTSTSTSTSTSDSTTSESESTTTSTSES